MLKLVKDQTQLVCGEHDIYVNTSERVVLSFPNRWPNLAIVAVGGLHRLSILPLLRIFYPSRPQWNEGTSIFAASIQRMGFVP